MTVVIKNHYTKSSKDHHRGTSFDSITGEATYEIKKGNQGPPA